MEKEIEARVTAILKSQKKLESKVKALQNLLFGEIGSRIVQFERRPDKFSTFFAQFIGSNVTPILEEVAQDTATIAELNREYFSAPMFKFYDVAPAYVKAYDRLRQNMGFDKKGELIDGGWLDNLAKDTTVQVKLRNEMLRLSQIKDDSKKAERVKLIVVGDDQKVGIYESFFTNNVYDVYQQSDRLVQKSVADEIDLQAAIYTGGKIEGTRPFCRARDGKIFIREEIEKFGTSADTYGGYENKSTGYFKGKPSNYSPFQDCGGYSCRHFWSWIASEIAVLRRDDLILDSSNRLILKAA